MILEFIGPSYFTSTIRGNIRWAATELFEVSGDDEERKAAAVLLSTECDIYSFGSIALQVSHFFRAKDLVHVVHALGADMQGTLLQCEEGYCSVVTSHQW
jgi:hypothetical protein